VIYLTPSELLHVAERAIGDVVAVRDPRLLPLAAARARVTVFGQDAYPSVPEKAAALLHSRARSHALVDGNNCLALAGVTAFLGVKGQRLTQTNDEAYDLMMGVAGGELDDVSTITGRPPAAARLRWAVHSSQRNARRAGV